MRSEGFWRKLATALVIITGAAALAALIAGITWTPATAYDPSATQVDTSLRPAYVRGYDGGYQIKIVGAVTSTGTDTITNAPVVRPVGSDGGAPVRVVLDTSNPGSVYGAGVGTALGVAQYATLSTGLSYTGRIPLTDRQLIKGTTATFYCIDVLNLSNTAAYVQLFDVTSAGDAGVQLGATIPAMEFYVPGNTTGVGAAGQQALCFPPGIQFTNGLVAACSFSEYGSTPCNGGSVAVFLVYR